MYLLEKDDIEIRDLVRVADLDFWETVLEFCKGNHILTFNTYDGNVEKWIMRYLILRRHADIAVLIKTTDFIINIIDEYLCELATLKIEWIKEVLENKKENAIVSGEERELFQECQKRLNFLNAIRGSIEI